MCAFKHNFFWVKHSLGGSRAKEQLSMVRPGPCRKVPLLAFTLNGSYHSFVIFKVNLKNASVKPHAKSMCTFNLDGHSWLLESWIKSQSEVCLCFFFLVSWYALELVKGVGKASRHF